MTQTTDQQSSEADHRRDRFHVHIDRDSFEVATETITGQQLRSLPNPPISDDRDLYKENPAGEDAVIGLTDVVTLREEGVTSFFTSPSQVTPGA
jgi:hypothetical protein